MEFATSDFDPADFARKQLRKGTASSSGFAALLSLRRAQSVFTGEPIPSVDYLESFDASKFARILPNKETAARRLVI